MDMEAVLNRIAERRKELNLSEAALGRNSGLSGDAVRNWRRAVADGKQPGANVNSLNAIARTLDVSYSWLTTGEESNEEAQGMAEKGNVYVSIGGDSNRKFTAEEAMNNLRDPKVAAEMNAVNEIKIGIKGDVAQIIATVDREGIAKLRKKLDAIESLLD